MPALLMSDAEVAEVQRRLIERDPQLDLPRAVPRLIATLHEREAEAQTARTDLMRARAEVADTERRMERLNVEIERRGAVLAAYRRAGVAISGALLEADRVVASYERGDIVILT